MNRTITAVCAAAIAAFSLYGWSQQLSEGRLQSLRGADAAAEDQASEEKPYSGRMPGGQKRIARTFLAQPPLIPHQIENLDRITLEGNPCLACHGPDNYKNTKAPRIGASHFEAQRKGAKTKVSAARYDCVSCHVPQAEARPLVANRFKSEPGATVQRRK